MSEQATAAAFPVGTRVRKRSDLSGWFSTSVGTVAGITSDSGNQVLVHWDGHPQPDWEPVGWLEPVTELASPDPPRAPERVLAPGIVQSDDTCDGKPRMEGTRVRCDSVYGWWTAGEPMSEIQRHFSTRTLETYELAAAVAFEAGRRWEKERRKAKRKRKADADAS
jgi:uncharacterized protein (DUF433 family)